MFSLDASAILINVGGPVVTALIISLITWVVRLLNQKKKKEAEENDELITTVADLVVAVKQITQSLGGSPATIFGGRHEGLLDAVSSLTGQIAGLTVVVNEHTEKLRLLNEGTNVTH